MLYCSAVFDPVPSLCDSSTKVLSFSTISSSLLFRPQKPIWQKLHISYLHLISQLMDPELESKKAKLLVGKFYFETTQDTLSQLNFFKAFFDEENMGSVPDENGVHIIDADGDQFEHSA